MFLYRHARKCRNCERDLAISYTHVFSQASFCFQIAFLWLYNVINTDQSCVVLLTVLNSLRPDDAFMRQWTWTSLDQIMACRLCGTKALSEPELTYCEIDPLKQKYFSDLNQNTTIVIQENYENIVHKMAAILSWPRCANFNTSMPKRNIHHQADGIFSCIFSTKNYSTMKCLTSGWIVVTKKYITMKCFWCRIFNRVL